MSLHKFWRNRDGSKAMKVGKIFLIVAAFLLLAFILGYWIMFLWNVTMAAIFDLPTITYWQAIGLFLLAKFFFGIGGSRSARPRKKHFKRHVDDSEDVYQIAASTSFKEFWRGEGREAYEAFKAAHKDVPENPTEEPDA